MPTYNVMVPVIAFVEAESDVAAIEKLRQYIAEKTLIDVYDGEPKPDVFESESLDPSIVRLT